MREVKYYTAFGATFFYNINANGFGIFFRLIDCHSVLKNYIYALIVFSITKNDYASY
jgi:hypothetical protein